jgi:hypothetical protein
MSPSHKANEYHFWDMTLFESGPLTESAKKYYLYAKVPRTGTAGTFLLSETSVGMEQVSGYYHLLVGLLNSEFEGERSFVKMYGFTEILPGQIFTDVISDPDRNLIIDMLARKIIADHGAEIIGKITFLPGTSGYDNITDRPDLNDWMDNVLFDANQYAGQIAKQAAGNAQAAAINESITTIEGARNALAQNLGYASYSDLVIKAQAGKTIIDGGYINTNLINANAIVTSELVAQRITAAMIAALNIVTSKLTVTSGAKIGGFNVVNSALSATTDTAAWLLMWPGDNKTKLSLGRNATNFAALGSNSLMGEIVNSNLPPGSASGSTIALILSAMGRMSGEEYNVKNYALVANGGILAAGALCVFDEVSGGDISNSSGNDASVLLKCRKFVYNPSSPKYLYLPGRAAIEALFASGLSYAGNGGGYMWSGKSVGYQSWIDLDILVSRYATSNVSVSSPASGTDLVDNNGAVISSRTMTKGDIITFCYYNNNWYMKVFT